MSDYYDIREVGGAKLAQHYPDRGQIPESHWFHAILKVDTHPAGFFGRLRNLSVSTQPFWAVLSANADGFRILISLDKFAIFIPWSEATVSAERTEPATVMHVQTKAVPKVTLVFHLDDAAADDLLRGIVPSLPVRDPPQRIFRLKTWAMGALLITMLAAAVLIASLKLPVEWFIVAAVATAIGIGLALAVLRPWLEDRS